MAIKTTKSLLLGLVVLLTILLFIQACKKDEKKDENSNLIGTHTLKKDLVKKVTENNQKVELTAIDFDITRCPPNVTCISGGYSKVKIKFKDETNEQTLELCIGECTIVSKPTHDVITLNNIKYDVKLEDVTSPSTLAQSMPATSKAILVISKATP